MCLRILWIWNARALNAYSGGNEVFLSQLDMNSANMHKQTILPTKDKHDLGLTLSNHIEILSRNTAYLIFLK